MTRAVSKLPLRGNSRGALNRIGLAVVLPRLGSIPFQPSSFSFNLLEKSYVLMSKFISLSPSPRRIQWVAGIMAMVGGCEGMYVDVCLYACVISTRDPKLLRRGKGIYIWDKEWEVDRRREVSE